MTTSASQARRRGQRERREFTEDCAEISRLVGELRRTGPALIERAAIPVADGFAGGRGYDGGPSGKGVASDPVLAKVIVLVDEPEGRRADPDPMGTEVARARAAVGAAVVELRRATNALADASRVPAAELEPDAQAPGCVNCHRFDVWSIVHKAGRCSACYGYRARNDGRDAPEHIVLARPEVAGRRHMIAATEVASATVWHEGQVFDLPAPPPPGPERELDQTA